MSETGRQDNRGDAQRWASRVAVKAVAPLRAASDHGEVATPALVANVQEYIEQAIQKQQEHVAHLQEALNGKAYDDLTNANIDTIRDIHEKTLRLISKLCSESLSAHPMHEGSYPKTLLIVEDVEQRPHPTDVHPRPPAAYRYE